MFASNAPAAGTIALTNASPVMGALPAPGASSAGGEAGATPQLAASHSSIDLSQLDSNVRDNSIKKVGEVVSAHPEEALAIIRTWLHQPV
jgi:flagellar M-ring protein FliF